MKHTLLSRSPQLFTTPTHSVESRPSRPPIHRTRRHVEVRGIVQGVGFRPFVYRLAERRGLSGWVLNDSQGVKIQVEGTPEAVADFMHALEQEAPPLARIDQLSSFEIEPRPEGEFVIRESSAHTDHATLISPDVATCHDCLRELLDPDDRRHLYPFINCTNCGPRYTIIEDLPYDRPLTTMRKFEMCETCAAEYADPRDRRFHAQPVACWACGPRLELLDQQGAPIDADDAIARTVGLLREGKILAIKGLGGFHLAVDATNEDAVRELRQRKRREEKPFAVMSPDLDSARTYCEVSEAGERLLASWPRPIVLLPKRFPNPLARSVAPKSKFFGSMLPYTPLHHLLLREAEVALVMTSANLSEKPICIDNDEALSRLEGIADSFLMHDRDIHLRSDDSVARIDLSGPVVLRRSRGYAPSPVKLAVGGAAEVLALGGELKNTVCLTRGGEAFLSQHIGDLRNFESLLFFRKTIEHLERILGVRPSLIAHDLHPDYLSTKEAVRLSQRALAEGVRLVGIQHHFAHVVSCMAEHGLTGQVLGVAFDGTGYGTDGHIWGGEFLVADRLEFRRVAKLKYVGMPGGDAAVKEPPRMAVSYLRDAFGERFQSVALRILDGWTDSQLNVLAAMLEKGLNCPKTSSMGRLFDAVAALTGVATRNTYEGQAAIELEAAAAADVSAAYQFGYAGPSEPGGSEMELDPAPAIREVVSDIEAEVDVATISAKFHNAVVQAILEVAERVRSREAISDVVLSGGVFQNSYLIQKLSPELEARGFAAFRHRDVPPNDGGIALGQAAVARARAASGVI